MTPATRFNNWIFVVFSLVVGQHGWFAFAHAFRFKGPFLTTLLLLGIIYLLLAAPFNAIRLKPWLSIVILSLLTILLYLHAFYRFAYGNNSWLFVGFTVLSAIFFTVAAVLKRRSPWWVVPLWWNALMVGPYALSNTTVATLSCVILLGIIFLPRKIELTA